MAHRKLLSLALAVAGVLALTTVSVPASLADDTQATEPAYASSSQENEGLYSVVIVQLTDDAPDLATMKERVAASVVAAVPGGYHHCYTRLHARSARIRHPSTAQFCQRDQGHAGRQERLRRPILQLD